jgi:tripartite ATP-independent transporter DctM subunit
MQQVDRLTPFGRIENCAAIAVLISMTALPLLEVGARLFGPGLAGSIPLVQHLMLWITMLGAGLASRSDRHLALSTLRVLPEQARTPIQVFTSALAAGITATLMWASLDFVRIERGAADTVAWGIPVWMALAIMPVGFAVITGRLIWHASDAVKGRLLASLGLLLPVLFGFVPALQEMDILLPCALVIVLATALGMPIFTAIGGAALLLFWHDGTPINAVPGETYRLSASPMLPAIPLFALGGYIFAEGGASQRLTKLLTALVGWVPGGLALVITCVLAFFTPLTGASGVTILSMGGILLPVLLNARYPENTAMGLVTVSGSIGLLFFPSLPVILYGYYANQPIEKLFVGGLLPGVLLVLVVAGWGARQGWRHGAQQTPFQAREAAAALWQAKWELLLPVVVLGSFFGGLATLVEAAALTVLYALITECFIHRGLHVTKDLPRVFVECATLVGGFMIILGVALGFTNFLILAEIPTRALEWVQLHIDSPLLFLLALNLFLIIVGALMDIYSAIIVIVPLIYPMAEAYGINPIHLGIIFLSNMELGYLMPPMGENLFLSAYRFEQPLSKIYRSTLPYVVILFAAVLLITYVPWLTLGLVNLLWP